jgi:hypothetical protein
MCRSKILTSEEREGGCISEAKASRHLSNQQGATVSTLMRRTCETCFNNLFCDDFILFFVK